MKSKHGDRRSGISNGFDFFPSAAFVSEPFDHEVDKPSEGDCIPYGVYSHQGCGKVCQCNPDAKVQEVRDCQELHVPGTPQQSVRTDLRPEYEVKESRECYVTASDLKCKRRVIRAEEKKYDLFGKNTEDNHDDERDGCHDHKRDLEACLGPVGIA